MEEVETDRESAAASAAQAAQTPGHWLDEVEELVDERAGSCHTSGEESDREDCDGAEAKDCRQVRWPRPSRQPLLLSGGRQALVSLLAARWKSPYPSSSGETEVKAHQEDPHPMDDDPTPSQLRSIGSNRLSRVKPGMRLLPPLLLLLPRLGHLLPRLPNVTCL